MAMRDDSDPLSTFEFRRSRSDRSPGRELLDLYNTQYAGRAARPGPVTPEDTARELGYERARLDSDPAQPPARRRQRLRRDRAVQHQPHLRLLR